DPDGGEIAGNAIIYKALDESSITEYRLYWGSDATTKQSSTPIAVGSATGSDIVHTFNANTVIPSSPAATHLLVFTANNDGEMATGVSVAITDIGPPVNAAQGISFTDTDGTAGEIAGIVAITKASDESDLTDYVLYWGSDAT